MKIFLSSFLLLLVSMSTRAQNPGKLVIRVYPENAVVHVDGSREDRRMLELKPGPHTVKVWAPEKELYEQQVLVKSDSTAYVQRLLRPSEEYRKYYKAMDNYRYSMLKYRAVRAGRVAAPLATLYFAYSALTEKGGINNDYRNKASEEKALYEKSMTQSELDIHRDNFNGYYSKYRTGVVLNYTSTGLMAGLSALLWIMENKKPEKPEYSETPKLSRLGFDVGGYVGNDVRFTLHYTF